MLELNIDYSLHTPLFSLNLMIMSGVGIQHFLNMAPITTKVYTNCTKWYISQKYHYLSAVSLLYTSFVNDHLRIAYDHCSHKISSSQIFNCFSFCIFLIIFIRQDLLPVFTICHHPKIMLEDTNDTGVPTVPSRSTCAPGLSTSQIKKTFSNYRPIVV